MTKHTLHTATALALAALSECRYATTDKSERMADEAIKALQDALTHSESNLAWCVTGTSEIYRGEWAEIDAKKSARRIGGDCRAVALVVFKK